MGLEFKLNLQPVQATCVDEFIMVVDQTKKTIVVMKDRRKRARITTADRLVKVAL